VFVVARDSAGPTMLTDSGLATATIPVLPDGRAPAVIEMADTQPEARFLFLAGTASEPVPPAVTTLESERWLQIDRPTLLADPRGEMRRVCEFLGMAYDQSLLTPIEAAVREEANDATDPTPFASVSTESFGALLQAAGASLLISTYQTNRLVCARMRPDGLNTHFRAFEKPMGVAVAQDRIALGTRTEVWDLRNMPQAAPKVEPAGTHDACYLPRNRHVTGDIAVHDLDFAEGQLFVVATAFSCLATLDADYSFTPRWAPPFITQLAPEDRCHLNGMAVIDNRIAYVTALGTTDTAGGWRERKADGGVLMDVASGEVAIAGLSMPHSPRWFAGQLWLLESGRGTLCRADPQSGTVETVTELPGFTRGLTFIGDTAFVGLSQIRESSTFGDLPVTHRLQERQSGVWMVNLRSGEISGLLRFEDLVQEIFDVAVLPGARNPELAAAEGAPTENSFALP
jgi:uncharacterized protein (TIGR03032 family)